MKKSMYLFCLLGALTAGFAAGAQKYRTTSDTLKLNKEYTEVSNDIATLTAKLAVAQNNLAGYQNRASAAGSSAQDAAATSSTQAARATNGNVKEAKRAKRKAKRAYHEAKDARSANNNLDDQDNKIASLTRQLERKQQRLQQLTEMRDTINAQLSVAPPPPQQ